MVLMDDGWIGDGIDGQRSYGWIGGWLDGQGEGVDRHVIRLNGKPQCWTVWMHGQGRRRIGGKVKRIERIVRVDERYVYANGYCLWVYDENSS